MKVAVTGASGHVGINLCRQLTIQGDEVSVLAHKNFDKLTGLNVEIIRGDLFDHESLLHLFEGVEVVFHLAAKIAIDQKDTDAVFRTNVEGTANVIEACKSAGVKKLVHFSTIHTLQSFDQLNENNPLVARSNFVYEHSKADAERLVVAAAAEGLDAVILNPTAIIGPYDYQPSYLGQALIKIYRNQLPMLVPGGYDFVDVRDVADAAIKAAKPGRSGERFILGGHWLSLKDLSIRIGELFNRKTPTFLAPTWVAKVGLPFIQGWAKFSGTHPLYTAESLVILKSACKNISHLKATKELGYVPRPMDETLKDTFTWYKENQLV